MRTGTASPTLEGRVVLSLESRRAAEMATLLRRRGAEVISAPSMREVPLSDQNNAFEFGEALLRGDVETLLLLTGVGTQMLFDALALRFGRDLVIQQLGRTGLYCRGPKPVSVLKHLGLHPTAVAPEPNTWQELVTTLASAGDWRGNRVHVQEYGIQNPRLMAALTELGAVAIPVVVYAWQLPEDVAPLREAVTKILDGTVSVIAFTSGHQFINLDLVAQQMGKQTQLLEKLSHGVVVASVGPVTTELLTDSGIRVDIEPSHPKMGHLVRAIAEYAYEAPAKHHP